MKKTIMLILALVPAVLLFVFLIFYLPILTVIDGLTSDSPPEIRYEVQTPVAPDQASTGEELVWYVRLRGPTSGANIVNVPPYQKYAAISADSIVAVDGSWQAAVSALNPTSETDKGPSETEEKPEEREWYRDAKQVAALLSADKRIADAIRDTDMLRPDAEVCHGGLVYLLCIEKNLHYTESIDDYTGSQILYVIMDEADGTILLARLYDLPEYWGGYQYEPILVDGEGNPVAIAGEETN